MKKIFLFAAMFTSFAAFSQDLFKPALQQGSKIKYIAHTDGQEIPMTVTLDSVTSSLLKLGWDIEGYGSGSWVMGSKSLESATKGWWGNPAVGTEEKVADDQQVLMISKALWASLQKDKKFEFDGQTFTVKEPTESEKLLVGGKTVDAILLQSGATKFWLLNDPNMPVLLKIEGNTKGVDLTVVQFQERALNVK